MIVPYAQLLVWQKPFSIFKVWVQCDLFNEVSPRGTLILFRGKSPSFFYVDMCHHCPRNITEVWLSLSVSLEPLRAGTVPFHLCGLSPTQTSCS